MSFSLVPGFAQRYPKSDDPDYVAGTMFQTPLPDPVGTPSPVIQSGSSVILSGAKDLLIETCCTTLEQARSAQFRGAGRIELCVDLSVGGVTPPRDLIREVVSRLTIPVNILVRPAMKRTSGALGYPSENNAAHGSGGGAHASAWEGGFQRDTLRDSTQAAFGFSSKDFIYGEEELQEMIDTIAFCKSVGATGVVLGALTPEGAIDRAAMRRLIAAAAPLPVTFHRAYDVCTADPFIALDQIIALGCTRLLTSGQAPNAWDGRGVLALLVRRAGPRLIVMPGCGITPDNLPALASATRALEFHGTRIP